MNIRKIAGIFSQLCYASVMGAGIAVYFLGHQPTDDTVRISKTDFLEANPEVNGAHFSAFGELYRNEHFTCSMELLEPGNLLTTANHCIDRTDPSATYQFVTSDSHGEEHTIDLDLHGDGEWNNVYIPAGTTINENEADIVFIPLYQPLPDTIVPAPIAGPQDAEVTEVIAIGFSRDVREFEETNTDRMSISASPCYAINNPEKEAMITSSCYVQPGDSGGNHAIWNQDNIPAAYAVHSSFSWINVVFNHVTRALENAGIYSDFNGSANSTLIYPYRDFCYEQIGAEFCTGFPEVTAPTALAP